MKQQEIHVNRTMVAHIDQVVGLSMRSLCARIGIPVNTFTHWTGQGTIRITELVTICNQFRIPFREFLCFGGEQERLRTADLIALPAEEFRPVVFRYERIRNCGKQAQPPMAVTLIAERMGISYSKFKKFYSLQQANNFTLDLFLQLCEVTGLPLTHFLDDDSYGHRSNQVLQPAKTVKVDRRVKEEAEEDSAARKLEQVLETNRRLLEQVKRMNRRIEQLEKRLEHAESLRNATTGTRRYGDDHHIDLMQAADSKDYPEK